MNSKDYWQERARRDKKHVLKQAEAGILSIKRLLKLNLDDVEKKITAFYDKYGENPKEELSYNEFQKYKRDLAKNIKKYPKDKTLKKILKQDAPKYRIDRLRELQTQLQTELTYYTDLQEKATLKTLSSVATLSDTVNAKTISDMTGLKFTRVSKNTLNQIVNQTWVGRKNWSERIWADRELVGKKLTTVLQKGVVQGKPLKNMAFELQDVTHNSFNNCFRIIRTETSHIDGQIKLKNGLQAEKDLGERLKYQYDAFLDDRTSNICRELDGKKFWLDKAEVGVNYPPAHCNCRSTTFILVDESVKKQDEKPKNEKKSQKDDKKEAISKMEKTTEEKPLTKDQKEENIKNIEFKDIKEAEKYAKDNFTKERFLDKTFKGEADYKNISLESAKEINNALNKIYKTLDIEKLAGLKVVNPTTSIGKKAFNNASEAMASFSPIQKGIFINEKIFKNSNAFNAHIIESNKAWDLVMSNIDKLKGTQKELAEIYKKAGRSLVDNSMQGSITHEVGHFIAWEVVPTDINNKLGENMSKYAPKLSGYANSSKGEYLAESFVAYINKEYDKIDPLYKETLDKLRR